MFDPGPYRNPSNIDAYGFKRDPNKKDLDVNYGEHHFERVENSRLRNRYFPIKIPGWCH